MITLGVDENNEGKRLDSFLTEECKDFSRSKIQTLIKAGNIQVNGKTQKPSYSLRDNDKITFIMPVTEEIKIQPENIPIEVIWENDDMAVINKPSGMLTHPTMQELNGTLVNALLYKYGENLSNINGDFRRGILHRLDRNTSGLLMIAKNNATHEFLAEKIKSHEIEKKYRAIVNGNYKNDNEIINLPIGRHPKVTHKMAVTPDGRESTTIVKVLERFKDATYIELTLITGRTHQIRVHLSHLKHPIYNDTLYGGVGKVHTEEQVLQSFHLKFTKPFSDEIIKLEIPPDEKIEKVLNYLKNKGN